MAYNGALPGTQTAMHKGRQWKRLLRIEKAALLTSKGIFSNEQIAAFIGIHVQTLVYLKQTPEFKSRMIALQTGLIEQHDIAIREDEEFQAQELKSMVPVALQKLKELLLSGNQHIALKATQDVLDREGTHAKVSRTAIDVKEQVNLNVVNQVAANIMNVLANAPKAPVQDSEAIGNKGEDEVTAEFTRGATNSTSQLYEMEESINQKTLEDLDSHKLKVN